MTMTSFTALTALITTEQHPVLAANLLLLQLHDLISTGTDGFSNAAETLVREDSACGVLRGSVRLLIGFEP